MSTWIEVIPYRAAPGRDYSNQKAVQADWDADKDFTVVEWGGMPASTTTNRADIRAMNASGEDIKVIVRYAKLQKTYAVSV